MLLILLSKFKKRSSSYISRNFETSALWFGFVSSAVLIPDKTVPFVKFQTLSPPWLVTTMLWTSAQLRVHAPLQSTPKTVQMKALNIDERDHRKWQNIRYLVKVVHVSRIAHHIFCYKLHKHNYLEVVQRPASLETLLSYLSTKAILSQLLRILLYLITAKVSDFYHLPQPRCIQFRTSQSADVLTSPHLGTSHRCIGMIS